MVAVQGWGFHKRTNSRKLLGLILTTRCVHLLEKKAGAGGEVISQRILQGAAYKNMYRKSEDSRCFKKTMDVELGCGSVH